MLIVLEGCDGVGKTYLAQLLQQEIEERTSASVNLVHRGVPERPLEDEYALNWYEPGQDQHYILDRWHLGEWVYGRLYRGGSELGLRGVRRIDHELRKLGALRIILDEDLATIRQRLIIKGEDYLQQEHQTKVICEYRMLAVNFLWLVMTSHADPSVLVDWAQSLEEEAILQW